MCSRRLSGARAAQTKTGERSVQQLLVDFRATYRDVAPEFVEYLEWHAAPTLARTCAQ